MRQRFVRPITSEDRTGLEEWHQRARTHDERRRAQFLLFSAVGHDLRHAAQRVGMSRQTADRTMRVFEESGVAAWRDVPRPGRVSALGAAARAEVAQVVRRTPREHGYATHNRTGPLLRDYLIRT